MRRGTLLAVVALVVLSGCTLPYSPDRFDDDRELGQIGDYAYDDSFAFDGEDRLTKAQLEAATYRSMARIEVIRGLPFEHDVELEVISREEYREQRGESANASAFRNELWRGAFVVDGETDVNRAFDELYGGAVQGYYSSDRIVLVTDGSDEFRVDRGTLVHELVHALQDQRFGLERRGETIDERRAENGVFEGEANYVPYLYEQRCEAEWDCLAKPPEPTAEIAERPFNVGLFLSIYVPYAEGPSFVSHLHETGGWEAVDRAHDERPTTTSELIRPERYPHDPIEIALEDRSSGEWDLETDGDGEPRTETVGEATLFGSLWANGVIDRPIDEGGTEPVPYNYSHPATDGWAGDEFRVYERADNETAHVWSLAWESEADAAAFADAYRDLLAANDAESVDDPDAAVDGVDAEAYRIGDEDPFAGAYRVAVDGDRVEIVGAPAVDDLEAVHASGGPSSGSVDSEPRLPTTAAPDSPGAGPDRPASAPADG
ncbi:Hvo_1808 family surface protein [Natronococcus sp.]|uniref:Hvo_1808 family surface protein n=1 Tax=Natronococcus sp. TaxID=35747 RepID=UPI003A4E2053